MKSFLSFMSGFLPVVAIGLLCLIAVTTLSGCRHTGPDDPRNVQVPEPQGLGVLLAGVVAISIARRIRK